MICPVIWAAAFETHWAGMFGGDFVERGDGGVDVGALQNVSREETQHCVAGAVDEDAGPGNDELGEVGRVKFRCNHQAFAADVDDGAVALG